MSVSSLCDENSAIKQPKISKEQLHSLSYLCYFVVKSYIPARENAANVYSFDAMLV